MLVDLGFLYLFIPLFILEIIFHFIQFSKIDFFSFLRVLLFISFLSLFINILFKKNKKVRYIVELIIVIWFNIYTFVELIFKNFMGDFYSFGTVSDGAGRIAQYALIFLSNAKPSYYLCFISLIVFILINKFVKFNEKGPYQLPAIFCILSFLLLVACFNLGSGLNSILKVYSTFSNKDIIIDKMGITHFFFRDLSALVYKAPDEIEVEIIEEEEIEEVVEEEKPKRIINDTNWKNIMNKEENSNVSTIDKYLMSKPIAQSNEKTGEFEDYNFIYFMVEALDYLSIDKDLTPTLYKMYKNGYTFYNHYTPLYSCATGESELVSYLSIFPYTNTCTPNYIAGDEYFEALPYLFKDKGYKTFALHNWRDEFYERKLILPALGFENYYDIDDIWQDKTIVHTDGWQSDSMLIEQAIKHIDENKENKFFCNIITSVMHFPYEEASHWGNYYIDEINKVHPDWIIDYKRYLSKCMDFDNGLKILLDYLKENNLDEKTVICIYPDHRPYWLDYDRVMDYTSWINERSGEYGIYRSPFIIYNSNMTPEVNYNYCSTLDHVPTIANMFNLHYDPRLYMGADIYDGNQNVIFTNGDWINEKGIYYSAAEKFVPYDDVEVDDAYLLKNNNSVQNTIKISHMILDEVYFSKRKMICYPR